MTPLQSKIARAALGWGIRDMPQKAGVASSTVARFEKGKNISLERYGALKVAYNENGIAFLKEGDVASGDGISFDFSDRPAGFGKPELNSAGTIRNNDA